MPCVHPVSKFWGAGFQTGPYPDHLALSVQGTQVGQGRPQPDCGAQVPVTTGKGSDVETERLSKAQWFDQSRSAHSGREWSKPENKTPQWSLGKRLSLNTGTGRVDKVVLSFWCGWGDCRHAGSCPSSRDSESLLVLLELYGDLRRGRVIPKLPENLL